MLLIQTHGGLILRNNAKIYTATQNLRQKDNLIETEKKIYSYINRESINWFKKIYINTLAQKELKNMFLKIHPYYSFGLRKIFTPTVHTIGQ